MTPLTEGGVEFESRLLEVDSRDARLYTVLDSSAPHGEGLILMCNWCKRV